ncbi:hypothetical protein EWM64_g3703 [Hericium alpestre]|uniref:Lipase-like C-terminal domain-containing protein n=1 Tax=Hericium alpestre TaxID=135208 RepID=A0A4Z0A3N9_9AGAM|nr:hypothetical protein EWM64_g3703 [Hericium alpestre]
MPSAGAGENATFTEPRRPNDQLISSSEPPPLIIVEGFLGGLGGEMVWGDFRTYINAETSLSTDILEYETRKIMFANVGPVSSLHDRACELFYTIMGGTVDYGETHSMKYGHARFGRCHSEGLYPGWSVERPLHFLGHSIGGMTIVALQRLLKDQFFGDKSRPDMMKSVSTVCSPFRGTQAVYALGERTNAAPAVRPMSIGSALSKTVHLLSYLAPVVSPFVDLHADSRRLSFLETSFSAFLRQLWKSDWAESKDAMPYEVTFAAADEREGIGEDVLHSRTFYRSYVARMTEPELSRNLRVEVPTADHLPVVPLYALAHSIGSFDFSVLDPSPSFLFKAPPPGQKVADDIEIIASVSPSDLGEEYWANDGVVPIFSQWHPFDCSRTRCRHYTRDPLGTQSKNGPMEKDAPRELIEPGMWHVHRLDQAHHVSIMPVWLGSQRQKDFWGDFGNWLRKVDAHGE